MISATDIPFKACRILNIYILIHQINDDDASFSELLELKRRGQTGKRSSYLVNMRDIDLNA